MSPVTRVGDWCASCLVRPAVRDSICWPCWELERAFPGSRRDLTELSRAEFHAEVYAWLEEAA